MRSGTGGDPLEVALRYPDSPDAGPDDAVRAGGVVGVPANPVPAMTLSEEHLLVGTEWVVSGRLRLRRRIVTEMVTIEVPVHREVLELHGDDVDFADGRLFGTDLDGEPVSPPDVIPPFVAVLREEVPLVSRRIRPYERVTVTTTRVHDTETVHGAVRHERIDTTVDPLPIPKEN